MTKNGSRVARYAQGCAFVRLVLFDPPQRHCRNYAQRQPPTHRHLCEPPDRMSGNGVFSPSAGEILPIRCLFLYCIGGFAPVCFKKAFSTTTEGLSTPARFCGIRESFEIYFVRNTGTNFEMPATPSGYWDIFCERSATAHCRCPCLENLVQ